MYRYCPRFALVTIDKRWHRQLRYVRNSLTARWEPCPCERSDSPEVEDRSSSDSRKHACDGELSNPIRKRLRHSADHDIAWATPVHSDNGLGCWSLLPRWPLLNNLVQVRFDTPLPIEGIEGTATLGAGLVVDPEQGLVIVDKATVPVSLGDVRLILGGVHEVDGTIECIHPVLHYSVVRFDPDHLRAAPAIAPNMLPICMEELRRGQQVFLLGLDEQGVPMVEHCIVSAANRSRLTIAELSASAQNIELVRVHGAGNSRGGMVLNTAGKVIAVAFPCNWQVCNPPDSLT